MCIQVHTHIRTFKKKKRQPSEWSHNAQWVNALDTKLDDLSSISRTHTGEENLLVEVISDFYLCTHRKKNFHKKNMQLW